MCDFNNGIMKLFHRRVSLIIVINAYVAYICQFFLIVKKRFFQGSQVRQQVFFRYIANMPLESNKFSTLLKRHKISFFLTVDRCPW
jgi:hypothetical protein